MKEQKIVIGIVVALIATASIFFFLSQRKSPEDIVAIGERALFGQHMKDQGVKFYGAFWCSHCQNQKKLLGKEAWEPIYIECSTPDGRDQTQVCKDAKIESYPTFEFKDGTRKSGEVTIADLEEKTGYKKKTGGENGTTTPK